MATRLITFATDDFTISADRLKATALRHGVENITIYREQDLFVDPFKHILIELLLPNSRGYGWWVWKPHIILDSLYYCRPGDILIYCDAGTEIVGDVKQVINAMDEDIFFCSNGWQHSHWCKREVAEVINSDCLDANFTINSSAYFIKKQVQASFIIFKVTDKVKAFVQEWLAWSIMPGFIDNTPRGPQFPEFQEHRHDQAICCCLQIKYGYHLHWFPSTMGMHLERNIKDSYPAILNHHRKRNNEW